LREVLVVPSPKDQSQDVIGDDPLAEWSVKSTSRGLIPLRGAALKSAVGATCGLRTASLFLAHP